MDKVKKSEKEVYKAYVNEINEDTAKALLEVIDDTKIDRLKKLKDFIKVKSDKPKVTIFSDGSCIRNPDGRFFSISFRKNCPCRPDRRWNVYSKKK